MVGWFRFEVIDSGVGMSVEQQKAVFEEFTHFKKNKLHGGGENSPHIYCICNLVTKYHDIRRQRTRIVDISPHCGYASGRVAASEDRSIRLLTIIIWIVLCSGCLRRPFRRPGPRKHLLFRAAAVRGRCRRAFHSFFRIDSGEPPQFEQ